MKQSSFGVSSWRPGSLSIIPKREMGQPPGAAAPQLTTIMESPEFAAMTDLAASASSAFLAYALQKNQNSWSTLWWIVSAATGVKFLHDISRF